jgi:superfamily II DNA or RNA helicase
MKLRDYQLRCSDAVIEAWKTDVSTLVVCPTGTGKTILFADIIRRRTIHRLPGSPNLKVMVLAHREELIWQARDKIQRVTGLHCEVEMGESRAEVNGLMGPVSVVVSTIQTHNSGGDGQGRLGKFNPMDYGLLIVDEAHHATSPSYRRVIDYYRTNPNLRVLGVTATPDRSDEEALGQVFGSVAFDYEILDAINDGWLVPIDQQMVNVEGLDFSKCRTTAGDLNGADLADVMEKEEMLQRIAGPSIDIIGEKRAIVFTASVAHAEKLCEIFNRHRCGMAGWVCGKTNKEERRKLLSDFAIGNVQVVCNCGVLTEGFDDPGVEVIIMGRPTKSRSLYSQMIGRSTRPLPGVVDGPEIPDLRKAAIAESAKKSALVIDFVGNSGKHKLMTSADILSGNVSDEVIARAEKRAKEAGKPVRMADEIAAAEEELRKEAEEKRQREIAQRARLVAKAKFTCQQISPFDAFQIQPVFERGWNTGKKLTERQSALLLKQGIDPGSVTYTQGKQLIGEIIRRFNDGLCSFRQAKTLKKYGYDANVTMKQASALIDGLARNGWRRPAAPIVVPRELETA